MATELVLYRRDGLPFGSFDEVQAKIRQEFPTVRFLWTTSGLEKIRIAHERGIELPPEIHKACESLPSLLEGVAQGQGYLVSFGLGHEEPVVYVYATPRGVSEEM